MTEKNKEVRNDLLMSGLDTSHIPLMIYANSDSLISGPRRHSALDFASPDQKLEGLRSACALNDPVTIMKSATSLMLQPSSAEIVTESINALRELHDAGYFPGFLPLAEALIDLRPGDADNAEGVEILERAVESGSTLAMVTLGTRLIKGDGMPLDRSGGISHLVKAGLSGDRVAMIILGLLEYQECVPHERGSEVSPWFYYAGAKNGKAIPRLGSHIYSRARASVTKKARQRLAEFAAECFKIGISKGYEDAFSCLNLAYLARRGEATLPSEVSLSSLLEGSLAKQIPFAIVNEALRLASGFDSEIDWNGADRLFSILPGGVGIFEWWRICMIEGDPEGHLVLAWLRRWCLIGANDGLSPAEHLERAASIYNDIPEWMYVKSC